MKVKYRGFFTVDRDVGYVFKFLTDPQRFVKVFPGCKGIVVTETSEFVIDMIINIGPLRGDVKLRGRFAEVTENKFIKIEGNGVGVNSSMDYILTFTLSSLNSSTRVEWVFEGTISGLAALLGERVLNKIAESLVEDIIKGIVEELSKP